MNFVRFEQTKFFYVKKLFNNISIIKKMFFVKALLAILGRSKLRSC